MNNDVYTICIDLIDADTPCPFLTCEDIDTINCSHNNSKDIDTMNNDALTPCYTCGTDRPINQGIQQWVPEIQQYVALCDTCGFNTEANNLTNQNTEKENTVTDIYHYMTIKVVDGKEIFTRYINTELIGQNWDRYQKSLVEGRPIDGIFALDMGDYRPVILEQAAARGERFTIRIVEHKTAHLIQEGELDDRISRANFHFSNADHSFFFRFFSIAEGEWTLAPLNLKANYSAKLGKRLAEVCRFSNHSVVLDADQVVFLDAEATKALIERPVGIFEAVDTSEIAETIVTNRPLVVGLFEIPAGEDVALYDGKNAISPRAAKMLGIDFKRGQIRGVGGRYMFKGDFVVSTGLGKVDIILCVENAKKELVSTDGKLTITASKHDVSHTLTMSVQAMTMNPAIFTPGRVKAEIMALHSQAMQIIETAEFPAWMELNAEYHGDGIAIEEQDFTQNYLRWQAAGFGLESSHNFAATAFNVLKSRITNCWDGKAKAYNRFPVTVSNAMSGAVTTYAALTKLARIELPEGIDTSVINVLPKYGVVIPDDRAAECLSILGGGDLDDTIGLILVKIWGSATAVANLVEDGALNPSINVPTNKEDAVNAVYIIRYPNGAGEFVIEPLGDVGFYNTKDVPVQTVCLDDVQRGVKHLVNNIQVMEMDKTEFVFGGSFTRENAKAMFDVQVNNPGIGRLAYASQIWCQAMGVSFPSVITGQFEDHVDGVQQGADGLVQAATLEEGYQYMMALADKIVADPTIKVDRALFNVCGKWITGNEMDRPEMVEVRKIISGALYDGTYTLASKLMQAVYKEITEKVSRMTLEAKANSEMAKNLRTIKLGQDAQEYGNSFVNTWNKHFREINLEFAKYSADNAFVKAQKRHNRSEAFSQAVTKMMGQLSAKEDRFILAVYKVTFASFTTSQGERMPASYDRVVFQSNKAGQSVSDLVLAALQRAGIGQG